MAEKPILFTGRSMQRILADAKTQTRRCHAKPRYAVGDLLWCRESSWIFGRWVENGKTAKGMLAWTFEAVGETVRFDEQTRLPRMQLGYHRRPSIFMPKWATREWLEVTDVRQERVQEISEEDAKAEGVSIEIDGANWMTYTRGFHNLWDSINGKKPGWAWHDNPVIFAYTFKRIEHPQ